jgi:NAD(P)-dependent dehydrogenase (short-subunit alcohol dehydrogenase family)
MKGSIVVLDASNGIGRAVVAAAVAAGRPVIAVSPDRAALKRLQAGHPGADLTVVRGSIADEASSSTLAAQLHDFGRPLAGVIVCSCREPGRGRLLEQSNDQLRRTLDDELLPQLTAARELIPLLARAGRNGSYVVIGGPGGEQPWAGYGQRSIASAATRMLLRVLHDEARALAVRVQLLAVEMPARTEDNDEHACDQWPSALAVAGRALELIDQVESREPAEAVVRFAWHATPAKVLAAVTPRRPTPRPAAPGRADDESAPMPSLDDTWALLKPLLASTHKKATQS